MEFLERRIAINTVLLGGTELLSKILSLVLIIFVARKLGPAIMGIYAFALSVTKFVDVFVNFGIDRYIQREVGRDHDVARVLFGQVFVLKSVIYVSASLLLIAVSFLVIDNDLKLLVIAVLLLTLFFRTNTTSTNAFFRAFQLARYEALLIVGFRAAYSCVGLAAILHGMGVVALVTIEMIAQMLACVIGWWLLAGRIGLPSLRVSMADLLNLAKTGKDFLLIKIVLTAYSSMDMLILSLMAGDVAAGFYAAAVRLSSSFEFVPEAFSGGFLPVISRRAREEQSAFVKVFRYYFKYILIVGLGLAVCLGSTAEDCLLLVFGRSFEPAVPALFILAIAIPLDYVNTSLFNGLIANDAEGRIPRIFIVAGVLNVLLNLALIPTLQHNGAALATLLCEFLVIGLLLRALWCADVRGLSLLNLSIKPVLAGLGTFAVVHYLGVAQFQNLFLGLFMTGSLFLVSLFFSGTISRHELAEVRALLPGRRGDHGSG